MDCTECDAVKAVALRVLTRPMYVDLGLGLLLLEKGEHVAVCGKCGAVFISERRVWEALRG